jgi:1-phosphatidylinositol-3-phosphate 5-kinase
MARKIDNPRIMLLSGGIDYTRSEHKIASLNTLLEQEAKYLQILVAKITRIKPDILIVGRSVSRRAQELLLETNIVLLQHVKPSLMDRIARQTGATILSSTDHVMNQFGTSVLGRCRRFRLVSFRDNDVWNNRYETPNLDSDLQNMIGNINDAQAVRSLLSSADLSNHQRQSILAARLMGEKPHDGANAIRRGILKRGVAQTYVIVEGCSSRLGCTVVLRGASRPALKEVKRILKFLINVAYNLKLETSYLIGRHAMLPNDYKLPEQSPMSSSLCVDYGQPPQGRKAVRPWNGGNSDKLQRSLSGKITALEHQSILISSVWMAGKTQCCPAEVKGICYYSQQDVSLGMFLRDSCFDLTLKWYVEVKLKLMYS